MEFFNILELHNPLQKIWKQQKIYLFTSTAMKKAMTKEIQRFRNSI